MVAHSYFVAKRSDLDADWQPSVPALVHLLAASGAPQLRAACAAAGLDGLRPAQAVALVPLAFGPLHASELATRLRVSRQAVAQAVRALESHGYLRRTPDTADGRALLIELTPHGRQALRIMRANALAVEQVWEHTLGSKRFQDLRDTWQLLLTSDQHRVEPLPD